MLAKSLAAWAAATFGIALALSRIGQVGAMMPSLADGLWITIQLTAAAALVAVSAALVSALVRLYGPRVLRWLALAYIEVFRGTSAMVQLFWFFFVLPHFGVRMEPMTAGILALGLCAGAYGSEIVRGAIQSIPQGQWEAAVALNFGPSATLRRVILPQAFAAMVPPWGNLFIELLKSTSLVSLITIADLSFKAQQLNQNTLRTGEIFTVVLLMYLSLSLLITLFMRALERRMANGTRRART